MKPMKKFKFTKKKLVYPQCKGKHWEVIGWAKEVKPKKKKV